MADGVKIRIVGDDSEFMQTLETLEKRAQGVLAGTNVGQTRLFSRLTAQLPAVTEGVARLMDIMSGRLTVDLSVGGSVASGIEDQQAEAETAAKDVASRVKSALRDRAGAFAAGVQAGAGYRSGLLSQRTAIIAAASGIASAAASALQGAAPAYSGGGTAMRGMSASVRVTPDAPYAVRRQTAGGGAAAAPLAADVSAGMGQPIYLNVDGRTLAQVLTGDMQHTLARRSRSMNMGIGR